MVMAWYIGLFFHYERQQYLQEIVTYYHFRFNHILTRLFLDFRIYVDLIV